jgi:hypothetical protein
MLELPLLSRTNRDIESSVVGPSFNTGGAPLLYSQRGAHFGAHNVRKVIGAKESRRRYFAAPFHTIVSQSTSKIFALIIFLYLLLVGFIAVLLWFNKNLHDDSCDLGMNSFVDAWWFALTTVTTIGYGAPAGYDIYFDGCVGVFFIVDLAVVLNMCFSAGVLSIVFIRISRVQPRASSILFSRNAVMKQVNDQWQFAFRVLELRKHQLTEAHVREHTTHDT